MGWSVGYDTNWCRDIGYGVPAICDSPDCDAAIDRGLSYVCGGEPYGGERGCGLYFCFEHLGYASATGPQLCAMCCMDEEPYEPKPDTREWIDHKLTHPSWQQWRDENPDEVAKLTAPATERSGEGE